MRGALVERGSLESLVLLADVARSLNDFRPVAETLDLVCRQVSGLRGYDFTAIFMLDEDHQRLVIGGSFGMTADYIEFINGDHQVSLDHADVRGPAPSADAYLNGAVVTVADIRDSTAYEGWQDSAQLLGYRSLVCVPIIVRSHAIGVLTCYGREPHRHTPPEIETLTLLGRLAGIAIETARLAESQRSTTAQLRAQSQRLRERNRELSTLAAILTRLTEGFAQDEASRLQRTVSVLAEEIGRSVVVYAISGRRIAASGPPDGVELLQRSVSAGSALRRLNVESVIHTHDASFVRVGTTGSPLGALVLHPPISDQDIPLAAATHAAAIVAAELQSERADRALIRFARPAVLLGLVRGLYPAVRLLEAAGVLGVPVDGRFRLARIRCAEAGDATRIATAMTDQRQAIGPVVATTIEDDGVIALLDASDVHSLEAALERLEQCPGAGVIGVSAPIGGLEGLPAAYEQASTAAAVGQRAGRMVRFEDIGALGQLAGELPPGRLRELVDEVLGPLYKHDAERGTQLVLSLGVYVRNHGQLRSAAGQLHLHPNTLYQRLKRCGDLAGFDLADYRDLGRVVLALELDRMLAARVSER